MPEHAIEEMPELCVQRKYNCQDGKHISHMLSAKYKHDHAENNTYHDVRGGIHADTVLKRTKIYKDIAARYDSCNQKTDKQ